ncbi:MAG: DUF3108 domain-containing protein [Deltaproteobacteria bacterium]|nr:DUF3108 domain-containing protein [Deltaproteobacteria bacterium]
MAFRFLILCLTILFAAPAHAATPELTAGQLLPQTLSVIFSGKEQLHYEVNWSGGVKIGDVHLEIVPAQSRPDAHNLIAKVISTGAIQTIYPVDDYFRCLVSGPLKLPRLYQTKQKEGPKQKTITRLTRYDQKAGVLRYKKNQRKEKQYLARGYNEMSAFIITRALKLTEDSGIVVPTIVSRQRHPVTMQLLGREKRRSLFGEVPTLKVRPVAQIKGVYEKGDKATLWLTDNVCRIPVEIEAHLTLGVLTARLTSYSNPACPDPGNKNP